MDELNQLGTAPVVPSPLRERGSAAPNSRGRVTPQRRIALIGYPADYFGGFGSALEEVGFHVYWVHGTRSSAGAHLRAAITPPHQILDTTEGFDPAAGDLERCRKDLADLECAGAPRIHDIILMDRVLRHKSQDFALKYLHHLQQVLTRFFTAGEVELASSGRDTALQLMGMLVCRKLGIPWVVPTRVRIPQERYMFTSGHETASTVFIRPPTAEDRAWAERFVSDFQERTLKPVLKAAATSFEDVVRMLPLHARLFGAALRSSGLDRGNDYSRYTIPRLLGMYLRRRLNMLSFKLLRPYESVADRPFCFYPLHTQPESSIDVAGSFFSDQIALITFIARSIPASHDLYVKIHQTDVDGKTQAFYRQVARIPGVRLIDYRASSGQLIEQADLIFVLTGTAGYEAALLGRPVVTFARNYYNTFPTVHYCDAPPQLPVLVDSLLNSTPPDGWRERVIEVMADLKAQSFPGEFNRMWQQESSPLRQDDLVGLQQSYTALYSRLVLSGRG